MLWIWICSELVSSNLLPFTIFLLSHYLFSIHVALSHDHIQEWCGEHDFEHLRSCLGNWHSKTNRTAEIIDGKGLKCGGPISRECLRWKSSSGRLWSGAGWNCLLRRGDLLSWVVAIGWNRLLRRGDLLSWVEKGQN